MKKWQEKNVLEAGIERLEYLFDNFKHIYFSFSGGKDSGAMIQLADQVAQRLSRTFDLLILDIEANYDSTCIFIEDMKTLPSVNTCYHFCLPFYEDNTVSIFQPQWLMWNPEEKDKWVQPLPIDAIQFQDLDAQLVKLYQATYGNPDRFLRFFSYWYKHQHNQEPVVCCIGIRSQESFNRYRAIVNGKKKFYGRAWINQYAKNVYNAYPIYDWQVEDIWGAVSKFQWKINLFYERLYKLGTPLSEMRICQPYGLQQRKSLNQYAVIEPRTWERVVKRVSGANFGRLYSKTTLLGHYKSKKPSHMSWQEYTVFLLETIGLYSKKLQYHYYRKIKILMKYYQVNFGMEVGDIPEEATRKEWERDEKLWHNWKGIAKAIEKNDFSLSTRQYSLTKQDEKELYELAEIFQSQLGLENLSQQEINKLKNSGWRMWK
ncbi:phosphoadenosine phosphosulfate reductase [Enterococcus casseliflavus]|nr:phosphoadenosine phosphosulfate reductase [Enterococcus casseliflavus]